MGDLTGLQQQVAKASRRKATISEAKVYRRYRRAYKRIRGKHSKFLGLWHDDEAAKKESSDYYRKTAKNDPRRPQVERAARRAYQDTFGDQPMYPAETIDVPDAQGQDKAKGGKAGGKAKGASGHTPKKATEKMVALAAQLAQLKKQVDFSCIGVEPPLKALDDFTKLLEGPSLVGKYYGEFGAFVGLLDDLQARGFIDPVAKPELKAPPSAEAARRVEKEVAQKTEVAKGGSFLQELGATFGISAGFAAVGTLAVRGLTHPKFLSTVAKGLARTGMGKEVASAIGKGAGGFLTAAMIGVNVALIWDSHKSFMENVKEVGFEATGFGPFFLKGCKEFAKGAQIVGQYAAENLDLLGLSLLVPGGFVPATILAFLRKKSPAMPVLGFAMVLDGLANIATGIGTMLEFVAGVLFAVAVVLAIVGAIGAICSGGLGAALLSYVPLLIEAGNALIELAEGFFILGYFLQPLALPFFGLARLLATGDPRAEAVTAFHAKQALEAFAVGYAGFAGGFVGGKVGNKAGEKFLGKRPAFKSQAEPGESGAAALWGKHKPKVREDWRNAKGFKEKFKVGGKVLAYGATYAMTDVWGADYRRVFRKEPWAERFRKFKEIHRPKKLRGTALIRRLDALVDADENFENMVLQMNRQVLQAGKTRKRRGRRPRAVRREQARIAAKRDRKARQLLPELYSSLKSQGYKIKEKDKATLLRFLKYGHEPHVQSEMMAFVKKHYKPKVQTGRVEAPSGADLSAPLMAELGHHVYERFLKHKGEAGWPEGVPVPPGFSGEKVLPDASDMAMLKASVASALKRSKCQATAATAQYVGEHDEFVLRGGQLDEILARRKKAYQELLALDQANNQLIDYYQSLKQGEKNAEAVLQDLQGMRKGIKGVEARIVQKEQVHQQAVAQHQTAMGSTNQGSAKMADLMGGIQGAMSGKVMGALNRPEAHEDTEGTTDGQGGAKAALQFAQSKGDVQGQMSGQQVTAVVGGQAQSIQKARQETKDAEAQAACIEALVMRDKEQVLEAQVKDLELLAQVQQFRAQREAQIGSLEESYESAVDSLEELGRLWTMERESVLNVYEKEARLMVFEKLVDESHLEELLELAAKFKEEMAKEGGEHEEEGGEHEGGEGGEGQEEDTSELKAEGEHEENATEEQDLSKESTEASETGAKSHETKETKTTEEAGKSVEESLKTPSTGDKTGAPHSVS